MQNPIISKYKRFAAGVMVFVMLAIMFFSSFYIAIESKHDCIGEHCHICVCIRYCEKAIHQVADETVLKIATAFLLVFLTVFAFVFASEFMHETIVSRKVRLNN